MEIRRPVAEQGERMREQRNAPLAMQEQGHAPLSLREQDRYRYADRRTVGTNRQEEERRILLHRVREKIRDILTGGQTQRAYAGIERIRQDARQEERREEERGEEDERQEDPGETVALHHARGTRFLEIGHDVLEFDMAGSGYSEFPCVHKGHSGKEGVDAGGSCCCGGGALDTADEMQRFTEQYGSREQGRSALRGKSHILSKQRQGQDTTKKRVTMAGPLALGGASNSGDYSIENLRQYMLTAAQEYLGPVFRRFRENADNIHPVDIIIKGHSRGAVAAGEGAKMIKQWIRSQYREFENFVRFELVQYDPVPGFGSRSGVNDEIDLSADDEGSRMAGLGEDAETTVVYSLHTQHTYWFTPQTVRGVKRMILTPFNHDVGLKQVDATQNIPQADGAQEHAERTVPRRGAFLDAGTGEVYRSSGLNELGEGVYIADENNVLVRMPDPETAVRIMESLWGQVSGQEDRHNKLREVVRAWFAAHGERGEEEHREG